MLGIWFAWPLEPQLRLCITICRSFCLLFGPDRSFSHRKKPKHSSLLCANLFRKSFARIKRYLLVSFDMNWLLPHHKRLVPGILIRNSSDGALWQLGYFATALNNFPGHLSIISELELGVLMTLSLHFVFSFCYWIPVSNFHLLWNLDNERLNNFQEARYLCITILRLWDNDYSVSFHLLSRLDDIIWEREGNKK